MTTEKTARVIRENQRVRLPIKTLQEGFEISRHRRSTRGRSLTWRLEIVGLSFKLQPIPRGTSSDSQTRFCFDENSMRVWANATVAKLKDIQRGMTRKKGTRKPQSLELVLLFVLVPWQRKRQCARENAYNLLQ
jgi:hypothetical protein